MIHDDFPPHAQARAAAAGGAQMTVTRASVPELIEAQRKQARAELRDRFAMAALTGLMACPDFDYTITPEQMASDAYLFADAMLKARDKSEGV